MQITEYDYTGISSAVAAAQTQSVKQSSEQQNEIKKVQEVKTDTYEHVENSDSLASIGIYDSTGKISGTGETEKQRSENNNNNSEESSEKNFAVKTESSEKPSGGGGAAPVTSSSDDDSDDDSEDSTKSQIVTINGVSYLETTVIKDGVKTVTRKNLENGNVDVTSSKA